MGMVGVRQRPSYKTNWLRSIANIIPQLLAQAGSAAVSSAFDRKPQTGMPMQGSRPTGTPVSIASPAPGPSVPAAAHAGMGAAQGIAGAMGGGIPPPSQPEQGVGGVWGQLMDHYEGLLEARKKTPQHLRNLISLPPDLRKAAVGSIEDMGEQMAWNPPEQARFKASPEGYQAPATRATGGFLRQILPKMSGAMAGGAAPPETEPELAPIQEPEPETPPGSEALASLLGRAEKAYEPVVPSKTRTNPFVAAMTRMGTEAGTAPGTSMEEGLSQAAITQQAKPEDFIERSMRYKQYSPWEKAAAKRWETKGREQTQWPRRRIMKQAGQEGAYERQRLRSSLGKPTVQYGGEPAYEPKPLNIPEELPLPGAGNKQRAIPPAPRGVDQGEWNRAVSRGIQKGLTPQQAAQAVMRHLGVR